MAIDPIELTAQLVQCPSVTPDEGGALVLLQELLSEAGFTCTRIERGGVSNLFARWGQQGNGRTFGFNGHTDVVPVGDAAAWSVDPFGAEQKDGILYGRGATDMKSGVAAFVAAAIDFVSETPPDGAIVITITGDEEGPGVDGTRAILDWMAENGERMDHCLVGEPTCPNTMGDMIKIGRRGSMTAYFTMRGVQGHSAYPDRANNPIPCMAELMSHLSSYTLDEGTEHFDASTLVVTTIDTGNPANNVIPAEVKSTVNIRFNDAHSSTDIIRWLRSEADRSAESYGLEIDMITTVSGESFVFEPDDLAVLVSDAVEAELGVTPAYSTSGGTSDARFVKDHCPVVEFGLVGKSMHQVNEHVETIQIQQLKFVYSRVLSKYFNG